VNKLDTLWLTEAISLRERDTGPLEDSEANRQARQGGGDFALRWEARALWLARRDGLVAALAHWKQGARLGLIALAVLALLSGAGMAATALAGAPSPVNVFWATGSLLGLNLLLLAGWLLGLVSGGNHGPWLGRLWLGLTQRLARDAKAAHLGTALISLLHRHRLNRWLLGATVNGLWTLCMLTTLATLLLMFATRRYDFVWETTLLDSHTFVALTVYLGKLPGWLGFPVPDAALIQASGNGPASLEGARQAWAGWLVGVLTCYGVLPRAIVASACWLRWRHGVARLQADLDSPGATALRERLMPSAEQLGASDLPAAPAWTPSVASQAPLGNGAVMVGIELDSDLPWPPAAGTRVSDAGLLDDRASRQRLLDTLAAQPPQRLLLACDPRRSPDRGTQALLAELSRNAGETRVWLMPPPPGETLDPARLQVWHQALEHLALVHDTVFPMAWLEPEHA
jgi:hypothetical protein